MGDKVEGCAVACEAGRSAWSRVRVASRQLLSKAAQSNLWCRQNSGRRWYVTPAVFSHCSRRSAVDASGLGAPLLGIGMLRHERQAVRRAVLSLQYKRRVAMIRFETRDGLKANESSGRTGSLTLAAVNTCLVLHSHRDVSALSQS